MARSGPASTAAIRQGLAVGEHQRWANRLKLDRSIDKTAGGRRGVTYHDDAKLERAGCPEAGLR
jgi:hypothetical protein